MSTASFDVVWPLGRHARAAAVRIEAKPRPPLDLNSATVAFVWNYTRKGDQMFRLIQGMLRSEYPDVSFIDYEMFGNIHGASEAEVVAALPQLLRQHQADVAVIGIGG